MIMDDESTSIEGDVDNGDFVEVSDDVLVMPYDFASLQLAELYDIFSTDKKNRMGFVARYVFVRLPDIISAYAKGFKEGEGVNKDFQIGKSIPSKKREIAAQRKAFVDLCSAGGKDFEKEVQTLCIQYFTDKHKKQQEASRKRKIGEASEGHVNMDDLSDNFVARVTHIAVEEGTRDLMEAIYECESNRMTVDNKELRVNELWEKIAHDFFNVSGWKLELFNRENFGEAGVHYIDPFNFVADPDEKFTGSNIRVAFNKLKTMY
jgi:hypothetical protein